MRWSGRRLVASSSSSSSSSRTGKASAESTGNPPACEIGCRVVVVVHRGGERVRDRISVDDKPPPVHLMSVALCSALRLRLPCQEASLAASVRPFF